MSSPRLILLASAALAAGCAPGMRAATRDHALPPPRESRAGTRSPGAGPGLVASQAEAHGDRCAALVRGALAGAGRPAPTGDAPALAAAAAARGALRRSGPAAGDLVFLADRPDGPPVHVGLVERVAPDGTALVLHQTVRGVVRLRANVARPWTARAESGRWMNDVLLVDGTRVPAGRLVVGFAKP
jgi:hypothetical protein